MKTHLYTIKDTVTGEMLMPFTEKNDATMLRAAKLMANSQKENYLNTNMGDKQVIRLGTCDNETGVIESKVEFVANAINLKTTIKEIKEELLKEKSNGKKD